jgi:hypothetical protein
MELGRQFGLGEAMGNRTARVSVLVATFLLALGAQTAFASTVGKAIDTREQTNQASAESQAKIDEISDDIDKMVAEYRRMLSETRALRIYAKQVEQLVTSQDEEMQSLRRQIDDVTHIGRQMTPLMLRMIDALEAFVALDTPFMRDERQKRVARLREMMNRADVSISEKYRRLLEAFQIENEYGRTIEAYRGALDRDGQSHTVDFLRLGRVALLYQTLDGEESGAWDSKRGRWVRLRDDYRLSIRKGLRMARKQIAPDLIRVPVVAADTVQQ